MAMAPPRRASIVSMVASKLTINAERSESVRVRLHLRWLGSQPGRVQVNAQERLNHESVPTPDSTLPLDAAARVVDQRSLWALSPIARFGAIAGVAGLVLRRFRRPDVLEPSRKDPASVLHQSHHAHTARRTSLGLPPGIPTPATADQPIINRIPFITICMQQCGATLTLRLFCALHPILSRRLRIRFQFRFAFQHQPPQFDSTIGSAQQMFRRQVWCESNTLRDQRVLHSLIAAGRPDWHQILLGS